MKKLKKEYVDFLKKISNKAKIDILKMTTVASSGHPGGAMSSLDLFLTTILFSNVFESSDYICKLKATGTELAEKSLFKLDALKEKDAFILSHGHTAPGWYAALAAFGVVDEDECLSGYRKLGSPFSGHVENNIPLISWDTGSLGQGLSAACAKAIYYKDKASDSQVYVFMGDGEQQKGQISEARRFIKKYELTNIHVFIDYNKLQVNGYIEDVMKQNIKAEWEADGFVTLEINGNDFDDIYIALETSKSDKKNNYVILANTVSGNGVSFMENESRYVASALKNDDCDKALAELKDDSGKGLQYYVDLRKHTDFKKVMEKYPRRDYQNDWETITEKISNKSKEYYECDHMVDCKVAYSDTLLEMCDEIEKTPVYVFDCDLCIAVKTDSFRKKFPGCFFQAGIQEHHTVTCAGALSKELALVFYSDFGVFGLYEPFNQHNLNVLNNANLKTVVTHCGMIGEDGKTHHCLNYIGVANALFDTKLIVPADANHTKDVLRYAAKHYGNQMVCLGRNVSHIVSGDGNTPFYGADYKFEYGKADIIFESDKRYLVSIGDAFHEAYKACLSMREKGETIGLIYISTPLKIDEELKGVFADKAIFVVEDHNVNCGLYKEISAFLGKNQVMCKLYSVGMDNFGESGNYAELLDKNGLSEEKIIEFIEQNG